MKTHLSNEGDREDYMNISPINAKKVSQLIIEQFINMIKEGKLKMGDRLPLSVLLQRCLM